MREGILSAIGNTPLVRLERVLKNIDFRLNANVSQHRDPALENLALRQQLAAQRRSSCHWSISVDT